MHISCEISGSSGVAPHDGSKNAHHHHNGYKVVFLWFTGLKPRFFWSPRHPSIKITRWETIPPRFLCLWWSRLSIDVDETDISNNVNVFTREFLKKNSFDLVTLNCFQRWYTLSFIRIKFIRGWDLPKFLSRKIEKPR